MKVEDSPKPVLKIRQRSAGTGKKVTNDDLPKSCHINNTWRGRVIPTLFRWAGTQPNPWSIPDSNITEALKIICDVYMMRQSIPTQPVWLFIWYVRVYTLPPYTNAYLRCSNGSLNDEVPLAPLLLPLSTLSSILTGIIVIRMPCARILL